MFWRRVFTHFRQRDASDSRLDRALSSGRRLSASAFRDHRADANRDEAGKRKAYRADSWLGLNHRHKEARDGEGRNSDLSHPIPL